MAVTQPCPSLSYFLLNALAIEIRIKAARGHDKATVNLLNYYPNILRLCYSKTLEMMSGLISMTDKIHEILDFWFGDLGSADLPTSDRTNLWFGENDDLKNKMLAVYKNEYIAATDNQLQHWAESPRGRLALIILLDQFSRWAHRNSKKAFNHDEAAQILCEEGLQQKMDHSLTLIERVFFYMPLVHAEDAQKQEQSIQLFQGLVALSMTETTQVYQLFLAYAYAHFRVIKEFGRFPQRNEILGRQSTSAEIAFLKSA